MKKRVLKAWTNALRSGKFKQTQGVLSTENGAFCALGVLCELYRSNGQGGYWDVKTPWYAYGGASVPTGYCRPFGGTQELHMAPEAVLEWSGLTREEAEEVSTDNDFGASFRQIADRLEAGGPYERVL